MPSCRDGMVRAMVYEEVSGDKRGDVSGVRRGCRFLINFTISIQ